MTLIDPNIPIWWLKPYQLKILIVVDGNGNSGFGDNAAFSLGEMLKAFQTGAGYHVQYKIDTAHRGFDASGGTPTFSNFRFTQTTGGFNLMNYDELWLFGIETQNVAGGHPMTAAELDVVGAFMNAGRGVFATGDHEDLGYNLCGQVPRVRSMRKWWFPHDRGAALGVGDPRHFADPGPGESTSPDGQPVAPSGESVNRHDTLRPEAGEIPSGIWTFSDQSDDIPQTITPTWYHVYSVFEKASYPHPLLCSPNGVIDVLPDHPHEGDCIVPVNMTRKFSQNGAQVDEYPTINGYQPTPEIVAYGNVLGGHRTEAPEGLPYTKPAVNSARFGVIGAYDGRAANVGRVVVDATWHHFFGINLRGTLPFAQHGTSTNHREVGFYASAAGLAKYRQIQVYYRNIALWLAPPAAQAAILNGWLWQLRWDYPIFEEFPWRERFTLNNILFVGTVARNALGKLAPQCQIISLIWNRIPILVKQRSPIPFPPDPQPWSTFPSEITQVFGPQAITEAVLGGAMAAIIERFPTLNEKSREEAEKLLPELIEEGGRRGFQAMTEYHQNLGKQLVRGAEEMNQLLNQR